MTKIYRDNDQNKAKIKIKNKDGVDEDYDTTLDIDVPAGYKAVFKSPIPPPTNYGDGQITWFNAYGIQDEKESDPSKNFKNVSYTVRLNPFPKAQGDVERRLFVYVNGKPLEITDKKLENGKIKFTYNVGDPPTGFYP